MNRTTAEMRSDAAGALQRGDPVAAARDYRELLATAPADAESWFNLGFAERASRNFNAALDAYANALQHGVPHPEEVHLNRAVIFADHLGDADSAERELQTALKLNPAFDAAAVNLGQLYEDAGEAESAGKLYEGLAEGVASSRAIARLSSILQSRGDTPQAIDRLHRALQSTSLTLDERAELTFAIASVLDASGDYAAAWQAINAANLMAAALVPGALRYNPAQHRQRIDGLITAPDLPQLPDDGADGPRPIFIVGSYRSGSTLAEQILGRHSAIQVGGELETLPAIVDALQSHPQSLAGSDADALRPWRARYLSEARAQHPRASWLTDKRQDNFLHIGLIRGLFPTAPIVHTVRDPLDTMLSLFFLHFANGVSYSFDLTHIAHWYSEYRRLMAHWEARHGHAITGLDYDDLVANTASTAGQLFHDIGLTIEPQCLEATPAGVSVRTASGWQVRQPIHARSSGRWRNYPEFASVMKSLGADDF